MTLLYFKQFICKILIVTVSALSIMGCNENIGGQIPVNKSQDKPLISKMQLSSSVNSLSEESMVFDYKESEFTYLYDPNTKNGNYTTITGIVGKFFFNDKYVVWLDKNLSVKSLSNLKLTSEPLQKQNFADFIGIHQNEFKPIVANTEKIIKIEQMSQLMITESGINNIDLLYLLSDSGNLYSYNFTDGSCKFETNNVEDIVNNGNLILLKRTENNLSLWLINYGYNPTKTKDVTTSSAKNVAKEYDEINHPFLSIESNGVSVVDIREEKYNNADGELKSVKKINKYQCDFGGSDKICKKQQQTVLKDSDFIKNDLIPGPIQKIFEVYGGNNKIKIVSINTTIPVINHEDISLRKILLTVGIDAGILLVGVILFHHFAMTKEKYANLSPGSDKQMKYGVEFYSLMDDFTDGEVGKFVENEFKTIETLSKSSFKALGGEDFLRLKDVMKTVSIDAVQSENDIRLIKAIQNKKPVIEKIHKLFVDGFVIQPEPRYRFSLDEINEDILNEGFVARTMLDVISHYNSLAETPLTDQEKVDFKLHVKNMQNVIKQRNMFKTGLDKIFHATDIKDFEIFWKEDDYVWIKNAILKKYNDQLTEHIWYEYIPNLNIDNVVDIGNIAPPLLEQPFFQDLCRQALYREVRGILNDQILKRTILPSLLLASAIDVTLFAALFDFSFKDKKLVSVAECNTDHSCAIGDLISWDGSDFRSMANKIMMINTGYIQTVVADDNKGNKYAVKIYHISDDSSCTDLYNHIKSQVAVFDGRYLVTAYNPQNNLYEKMPIVDSSGNICGLSSEEAITFIKHL